MLVLERHVNVVAKACDVIRLTLAAHGSERLDRIGLHRGGDGRDGRAAQEGCCGERSAEQEGLAGKSDVHGPIPQCHRSIPHRDHPPPTAWTQGCGELTEHGRPVGNVQHNGLALNYKARMAAP